MIMLHHKLSKQAFFLSPSLIGSINDTIYLLTKRIAPKGLKTILRDTITISLDTRIMFGDLQL